MMRNEDSDENRGTKTKARSRMRSWTEYGALRHEDLGSPDTDPFQLLCTVCGE